MKVESASREMNLEPFGILVHKGVGSVAITQGETNHVKITAAPEIVDFVRAIQKGDVLEITMSDPIEVGLRSLFNLKSPSYQVEITCSNLREIVQRGVGDVRSVGVLHASELRVENRGVGDVSLDVQTETLNSQLLGVGSINISGTAKTHHAAIKGTGKLEAFDLATEITHITSNGVGTSRISASEQLFAELNGVGRIIYRGNPRVDSKLNGLGSIVRE